VTAQESVTDGRADRPGGTAPAYVASLQNVSLRYGKRAGPGLSRRGSEPVVALQQITLQISAGSVAGLIGPDGVGKSSLLALIAGAREIQSGRVEVVGGNMASAGYRRTVCPRIAYMPQGLGKNLYPRLSVFENIDFFGSLFGQSVSDRSQRIAALAAGTGLTPFMSRPVGKLSGGMKQKLGLCCALIHDSDLLILDEPTNGIDPLSRRQFWQLVDDIRRQRPKLSVLVATANMEEAAGFDWLVAMDDARVLASGTVSDLLQQTATETLQQAFVALLPEAKRRLHQQVEIPPSMITDGSQAAIEANGLSIRFGDFVAVDNVSFKIDRGEIFGFVGSNGCGKTTTMKMLTGLLAPSEGAARLFGEPIDPHDLATRCRVGYMSQSFSLYSELTVSQNLILHARLFHVPAEQVARRVEQMVERFGLRGVSDQLPAGLPLGIRQRLSLAVAMIHQPEILILDESRLRALTRWLVTPSGTCSASCPETMA